MAAKRTAVLLGVGLALMVGLLGPVQADATETITTTLEDVVQAMVDKDRDAISALLDTRGFCALGGADGEVGMADRDEFIDWLMAQPIGDGSDLGELSVEIWGGVALATGPLTLQPANDEIQVLAILSLDRANWKVNALVSFDALTEDAGGAVVAREIHQAFVAASEEADPETAIDYLNEDSFVTVVSDPMGMSHIFTNADVLRQMMQTVASSEGQMTATFGDAEVLGDDGIGVVTCDIDVKFGGMTMPMRGVFLVADIDGEWVVPLLAVGPVPDTHEEEGPDA